MMSTPNIKNIEVGDIVRFKTESAYSAVYDKLFTVYNIYHRQGITYFSVSACPEDEICYGPLTEAHIELASKWNPADYEKFYDAHV